MLPDLRIVFLVALVLTGVFYTIRFGSAVAAGDLLRTVAGALFLVTALVTAGTFFALLFRVDVAPIVRETAYELGFRQLVSFEQAIPPNLEENLEVAEISRIDTDGDGFREWVVFYRFDDGGEVNSPIQGVIYDNDRGNPPLIFPYALRVPSRDYLDEFGGPLNEITFELKDVTTDQNGPEQSDLPEIVVGGGKELSIFRFRKNSEIWDFPRDAPPRYEAIGFFRGSGNAVYDEESNTVIVMDRNGFERSQLAVRSIYAVNLSTNTFWDRFYSVTELDRKLNAPIYSSIDFFAGPPNDIYNTAFPEKIVLAFYASTCVDNEVNTLCRNAAEDWTPGEFLTGDALVEFDNNRPEFFGLFDFNGTREIAVSHLQYYPRLETDSDLLTTGGGRDVVTGEEGQLDIVDIEFVVDGSPIQMARYKMTRVNGQWKIAARLQSNVPLDSLLEPPAAP